MKYGYYDSAEDDGFELIASADAGGGYDWQVFGLFRGPDGALYTASDGGCSCNGPWEYRPEFTRVGSVQEAISQLASDVREEADPYGYYFSQADLDSFTKEALAVRL